MDISCGAHVSMPLDEFVSGSQLELCEVVKIFESVCGAVGWAHDRGLAFLDLSASAVYVEQDEHQLLLSVSGSEIVDIPLSRSANGIVHGRIQAEQVWKGTNLRQLGEILSLMLAGCVDQSDVRLARILMKLESFRPGERYESVDHVLEDLKRWREIRMIDSMRGEVNCSGYATPPPENVDMPTALRWSLS